ncbi:MAG TPA: carbon-nitrogen hydrolase family protein [Tahibacter sp.]|uniref:carbon-nitrogen hydrolase family protein n=1 Tax=Tahibacter sp. TaxID=2056211 RepID=UPI002BC2436B|nr:carbon-nitrogen hydrolase family protein [Tahibacter sp.]HSX59844.1 carbon-nitrogen hydrolase family protein [Tahibacter sp.]
MRVACAQWPIAAPADFAGHAARLQREVGAVAAQGAALAVFPEYLALELAGSFADECRRDFAASLAALQPLYADWQALFAGLARDSGVHVLAGTFLLRQANGRYRNRAELFAPDGRRWFQDKLTLTGFEHASGVIERGDRLQVFDTALGRLAVNVCYDCEFPLYARRQYEAGARLLLVPSCTDTPAGATRVRVGCAARALENQIHVVQSVTAGDAAWSPALDTNTGIAAVFAPSDRGLPDDGIVAQAQPGTLWSYADVDADALARVRRDGQVANAADWDAQLRPDVAAAAVVR